MKLRNITSGVRLIISVIIALLVAERMGDDMDGDDEENDVEEHRDPETGKIIHVTGEAPPCWTTTSQWFLVSVQGTRFPSGSIGRTS
jgi:hypothetical protein